MRKNEGIYTNTQRGTNVPRRFDMREYVPCCQLTTATDGMIYILVLDEYLASRLH